MTTVTIVSIPSADGSRHYQAVVGDRCSDGKTPGELDTVRAGFVDTRFRSTLIVLQNNLPDQFFAALQRDRLEALMRQWRAARDQGVQLPHAEQCELDQLVQAELQAVGEARAMAESLGK
ncbi:MAG: hypothetical protein R3C56_33170 [Pirellulaceae bacterium]